MILSISEAERFYVILNGILLYANERLDLGEVPDRDLIFEPEAQSHIFDELFRSPDTVQLIDDYANENPLHLPKAELDIARSWMVCENSEYCVVKRGRGRSLFLNSQGNAFRVCGLTQEVSEVLPDQISFVRTALLPFKGRIVYSGVMSSFSVDVGPGLRRHIMDDVARAEKDQTIVSSAAELARLMPQIKEAHERAAVEKMMEDLDQSQLTGDDIEGFHRGKLAGLPEEERERLSSEEANRRVLEGKHNPIARYLKDVSFKHPGSTDLASLLGLLTKDHLLSVARAVPLEGLDRKKKDVVVAAVADGIASNARCVERWVRRLEPEDLASLQELVEAGGARRLPKDASSVKGCLVSREPLAFMLCDDVGYVCQVPDELMACLVLLDWDELAENATRECEIAHFVDTAADLRGVCDLDELHKEWEKVVGEPIDPDDVLDAAADYAHSSRYSYDIIWPDDHPYAVDLDLLDALSDEQILRLYQRARAKAGERPVTKEMLGYRELFEWRYAQPAAVALRDFLNDFVPNSQDDYFFAEKVTEEVVSMSAGGYQIQDFMQLFEDFDLVLPEWQLNRLLELLGNLLNSLPSWENCGWSPNELTARDLGRAGGKIFFNPDGSVMKVGRNDPCPCGSGKKYKKCCGR